MILILIFINKKTRNTFEYFLLIIIITTFVELLL